MTTQEIIRKISGRFPTVETTIIDGENALNVLTDKDAIVQLCAFIKNELGYDYLQFLTCIDRLDKLEIHYHLYAYASQGTIIVKTSVERVGGKIQSVAALWKAADWHEREAYDLFGVVFEGHPGLRRILLEEDFVGHPLLKDFKGKNVVVFPKI